MEKYEHIDRSTCKSHRAKSEGTVEDQDPGGGEKREVGGEMRADEWTADIWRCRGSGYKAFFPVASTSYYHVFLGVFPYLQGCHSKPGFTLALGHGFEYLLFPEESFFSSLKTKGNIGALSFTSRPQTTQTA